MHLTLATQTIENAKNTAVSAIFRINKKILLLTRLYQQQYQLWWRRGESLLTNATCHRHIAPDPAGRCSSRAIGVRFDSLLTAMYQTKNPPIKGGFSFGGGEGSRTPVRQRYDKTFSGRS